MASFTPSQQSAGQHQGNNGNDLTNAAGTALSTNPSPLQSIGPYRIPLSTQAVGPRPNSHNLQAVCAAFTTHPSYPYNSPFVCVSDQPNTSHTQQTTIQPNTSYTQQTTIQQAYPIGQFNHSYRQQAPAQQAYPSNYHLAPSYPFPPNSYLGLTGQAFPPQYQIYYYYHPSAVTHPQSSLRTTAAAPPQQQQPEQQSIQARRLAPRTVLSPAMMSNGNNNNPTRQGQQSVSLATHEQQQPTSCAMQRQPATPARNIDHYGSEEVSPRSKPNRAPQVEAYGDLMGAAQAHLARLSQSVPQTQGMSPPTTRSSTNSSFPPLSRAAPQELTAAVANASTAETTQQLVDLTRPRPASNATSQDQQEPETFAEFWDSLDPSEFDSHSPPVISGDQQEPPADFPDFLETNHRAAQTVAGVPSQSRGYTPHASSPPWPPGAAASQQQVPPPPGLLSPPARSTAGTASLPPASTTAVMSPPHPRAAINPGDSPEQARPAAYMHSNSPEKARPAAYMHSNPSRLEPGMRAHVTPWEGQSYPEGSYRVRNGSSQSPSPAFPVVTPPEYLAKQARKNSEERKRKREEEEVEALGSVTPPESPRMVGEVGFPSVVAASYGNQGEPSKRSRTEPRLEPFPSLMGTHQANESRPRGHLFPGYADTRHPIPPATAYRNIQPAPQSRPHYMNIHRTQESSPPYMTNQQRQESSPPYMINQETQTAAPAHMVNQQTQAARPDPQPTRVDAEMGE